MARSGILFVLCAFAIAAFTQKIKSKSAPGTLADSTAYAVPENIQSIIDKSCYDCHNGESKNLKAKTKFRFDKMHELDTKKMVSKLDEIIEVVDELEMPPKKFVEKNPDAQPSDEEYAMLKAWAEEQAKLLMN
ncbi:MAG: heme-binding domain-containing protein [Cyclobacteriaceae bacterium]|nr:heme-binding domain-containing protein [Cyclobacteriaceae bacterium]